MSQGPNESDGWPGSDDPPPDGSAQPPGGWPGGGVSPAGPAEPPADESASAPSAPASDGGAGAGAEPPPVSGLGSVHETAYAPSSSREAHGGPTIHVPSSPTGPSLLAAPRTPTGPTPGGSAGSGSGSATGVSSPFVVREEPRPGQILFDGYLVERLLGRGGMGTVWLVRHTGLDERRALKLIIPESEFDPQVLARFRGEARIMAKLKSRNAVAVHNARISPTGAYIEMEYLDGTSLDKEIRRGVPTPPDVVADLLDQICNVLDEAHALGIVHRDLKPSNLMLVPDRAPGTRLLKVLDFGIAKVLGDALGEDSVKTHGDSFIGTAQYSSPEQCHHTDLDGRSDIYSVGVILYELLTGYRPFDGGAMQQMRHHAETTPPPMAARNPAAQVRPEVEEVVRRCLEKKPDRRPQTARELAETFRYAVQGVAPFDPHAAQPTVIGYDGHTATAGQSAHGPVRPGGATPSTGTGYPATRPGTAVATPTPSPLGTAGAVEQVHPPPPRRWPVAAAVGLVVLTAGLAVGVAKWKGVFPPRVVTAERPDGGAAGTGVVPKTTPTGATDHPGGAAGTTHAAVPPTPAGGADGPTTSPGTAANRVTVAARDRGTPPLDPGKLRGRWKSQGFEPEGEPAAGAMPAALVLNVEGRRRRYEAKFEGRCYLPAGFTVPPGTPFDPTDGWPSVIVGPDDARYVRVAGGTFEMGSNDLESARPKHEVTLTGFYMKRTEVTNGELRAYFDANMIKPEDQFADWLDNVETFRNVLGEREGGAVEGKPAAQGGWRAKADLHPAVKVDHPLAAAYAAWAGGRLPTEAQWEYAARSRGLPGVLLPWEFDPSRQDADQAPEPGPANLMPPNGGLPFKPFLTAEVGSFPWDTTQQGVVDLAGNVREWCRDAWRSKPPTGPPVDPCALKADPDALGLFAVRGGSFEYPRADVNVRARKKEKGTAMKYDLGFRVVVETPYLPPPAPGAAAPAE